MASCPYARVVCSPRAHPTHAQKDKAASPGCPNEGRTWKQTTGSFQKELNGPTAARGLTMLASEPLVSGWLHLISIVWITLLGPRSPEDSNTCVKMAIRSWQQKLHLCD